jgi:hypothetical protein
MVLYIHIDTAIGKEEVNTLPVSVLCCVVEGAPSTSISAHRVNPRVSRQYFDYFQMS